MEQQHTLSPQQSSDINLPVHNRLRLLKLSRGDTWPERRLCELALVLECPPNGLAISDLETRLFEGELALLPLGNGLKAASSGRVLSLELERSLAPPKPQRLSDSLISQLMRRAWSSIFSTPQILEPTLELINVLADQRVRDHQEHLDLLTTIDHRIAVVIDYIDANCVNSLTVAKLAKMACMSPSRLSVRFKAATGETVWGYFQRRRCEKAHQLLSETSASVSDIAYQVGFSSQAHFTQSFKRRFNTTPGRFRQNAKK